MKMKKLKSIINPMSEKQKVVGDKIVGLDDEGIGDKIVGFAKFASPKKGNRGATVDINGFAKIVNKNKHNRNKDVIAQSMIEAKQEIGINVGGDKSGFAKNVKNTKKRSRPASASTGKAGFTGTKQPMNEAKSLQAASLDDKGIGGGATQVMKLTTEKCGYTDQVRMRRLIRNNAENVTTHSGQSIPANSGQHENAQSGQRVPPHSGPHSPTQSRQRTSQSGQSTPNESLQLTAQSRQQTPEAQSGQRTSGAQSEPNEHIPTPSTVNVSSTAANDIGYWNLGSTQRDGRVRVEVINGILEPSYYCSAKNRQIIHEQLEPTGYNWKSISKATQNFYFEEFKKYFVWRQSDAIIYKGWLANARKKYSEIVSVARRNWEIYNRRDNRIGLNVYLSWVEFWKTESFQTKSGIQRGNRRSRVDGRPSTHTSGSASHRTVAARAKVQYKRDPTADEIFYLTYTRRVKKKKNLIGEEAGENDIDDEDDEEVEIVWIDKKSQQIYETFLQLREQHEKSGKPVDRNALFLEAVGGPNKKNRVYGFGSSQSLFYQSSTIMPFTSFSATEEENQLLKHQLIKMNDRMKEVEKQLAMVMEATSLRVERSQSLGLDDQDDNN